MVGIGGVSGAVLDAVLDALMGDSGHDRTDRSCGGVRFGGILSGGGHYIGCLGL